jgi:FHS family L-fucose permease-like MFS transporter
MALPQEELVRIQGQELEAVTTTYMVLGAIMLVILAAIWLTRMPDLKEDDKNVDFKGSVKRLVHNGNYVWGVVAQFFYMGAQIATWSFVIRYAMQNLHLDSVVSSLGPDASTAMIMDALRNVEPVGAGFYNVCEFIGLDALLPRTAEQAGATYYIMSLILFVIARFLCTWLMKWIKPRNLLAWVGVIAICCCMLAAFSHNLLGLYALMCISGCMSLMFPTIYSMGVKGLGEDTKFGGSGMVMAIAGAAVLTQIQGIVSDSIGSIAYAYVVPGIAFAVVTFYAFVICRKYDAD